MSSTTLEIQRAQAQAREKEHQDKQNELQLEQNELAKIEQSEVENEAAAVSAASGNLKNEVKLCRYCSLGSKHLKRIQQLLRDGVNPNCLVKNTSLSRHETQTQQVASSPDELGFGGMVDMDNLLTKGQLIVEKLGPLHWAARGGHGEVIKVLLANGGDPNLPSEPFEHTPLHVAAVENKSVAIRLLVAGGADLERKTGTHDRKSHPLHMAAREGNTDAMGTLLDCGADINSVLSSARTPLLVAAANGMCSAVELLIQRGCSITKGPADKKLTFWNVSRCQSPSRAARIVNALKNVFVKGRSILDLSDCGLTTVPIGISRCNNIRQLILCDNQIGTIPAVLFEMPFVQQIDLRGNRLPMSVMKALWSNPQPFLKELKLGRPMACGEMKLMVIGQENVGKTTLIRWLKRERDDNISMKTITTDGIDISSIGLGGDDGGITFTTWDFAGQDDYHLTHQFFLSENGIYVLVWDMSNPPLKSKMEWWLQSIASRAHSAPVVLLGTHLDDVMKSTVPLWDPKEISGASMKQEKSQEYSPSKWLEQVQTELRNTVQTRYPNIECIMFLDGNEGRGLEMVKETLLDIGKHRATSIPCSYLVLGEVVEMYAERLEKIDAPPVIEFKEVYKFVKDNSDFFQQIKELKSPLDDEEEGGERGEMKRLEGGLLFLHDMGKVIYFGGEGGGIGSKVVLRPQWLTRCLACIVTQEVKGTYIKEGRILHSDLINFVWRSNTFPDSLHSFLLHVLETYEVIFPMPNQPDVHIVPSLLPVKRPSEQLKMFPPLLRPLEDTSSSTLSLLNRVYVFNFLPSGLITRLFIRLMKYYSNFTDCIYWRHGLCLRLTITTAQEETSHTYILAELHEKERAVDLRVRSTIKSVSSSVLLVVTGLLQNLIHEWYHLSPSNYIIYVPCLSCLANPVEGRLAELEKSKKRADTTTQATSPPASPTLPTRAPPTSPRGFFTSSLPSSPRGFSISSSGSLPPSASSSSPNFTPFSMASPRSSSSIQRASFTAHGTRTRQASMTNFQTPSQNATNTSSLSYRNASASVGGRGGERERGLGGSFLRKSVAMGAKENNVLRVYLEGREYGATAMTISVSPGMSVKQAKIQVAKSLLKRTAKTDRETLEKLTSRNRLYVVETSGEIHLLDEEKSMLIYLEDFPLSFIFFSKGRPTFVPCDTEYSEIKPGRFTLADCESAFMEGKMVIGCVICASPVSLPSLVPDVVLADVEQYGCEVVKEGTLKIIRKVGKGAFGDVFHGKYKKRDVAVKQILLGTSKAAEILQEFQKELRLGSMLNHPNVVKIEAFTMHPFQLVMEFIPLGDLYSYLNDPKGVMKYLSRIDDTLEREILPTRRSAPPSNSPCLSSLPLPCAVNIVRFCLGKKGGEELAKAERNLASVCRLLFLAVKDYRGQMEVQANKQKMVSSWKEMKASLKDSSLCEEGEKVVQEFLKRADSRLQSDENKMSYDTAKQLHQGYLDSMDNVQNWHAACLKHLALSSELRLRLAIDIAAGMAYLHSRSPPIIHRDLKTPNVLLMSVDPHHDGPLAKVSDFGASAQMFMASLQSGTIGSEDKAKKHVVSLTTWLAPEILLGQNYSKPSDVYAVGIMMWELLTRRHPFDHLGSVMNEVKVRQKVPSDDADNRPPIPEDGPKNYCELMKKCWAGDARSRPRMGEVLAALIEMAQQLKTIKNLDDIENQMSTLQFVTEEQDDQAPKIVKEEKIDKKEVKKMKGNVQELKREEQEGGLGVYERDGAVRVTCLTIAEQEKQIWTGFSDGSLDVYFSETGKLLVQKENAHEGGIFDMMYLRGRVWTVGLDHTIFIWACNDIPVNTVDKVGYLWKLSPSSKIRENWQKRWFVLDAAKHEIRYFENQKSTKQKGTISLQIKERRVARKEKATDNEKLNALFDEKPDAMWGGSLEVGGGEIEEGEEGGERATGRGDFSEGSSLMADSADVSVQNVVSHRGQFKVISENRTYSLKAATDDDEGGKNEWMSAIIQAIVKPINPVRSIFPDGPLSSPFSHMMSLDERTENIIVPMACSVDLYGEQNFKRVGRINLKEGSCLVGVKPMFPYLATALKRSIVFLNITTNRLMTGVLLSGVDSDITCLDVMKMPSPVVFVGTSHGTLYAFQTIVLRSGGRDGPFATVKTPFKKIRHIVVVSRNALVVSGEGSPGIYQYIFDQENNPHFSDPEHFKGDNDIIQLHSTPKGCISLSSGGKLSHYS